VVSQTKLSAGKHEIVVTLMPETDKPGGPARVALSLDGKVVATGHLEEQVPQRCGTECMDVGMDCISPVCSDYEDRGLFPFTGTIERVTFDFENVKEPTGMERLEMATSMD
jgi:arylsulfatase